MLKLILPALIPCAVYILPVPIHFLVKLLPALIQFLSWLLPILFRHLPVGADCGNRAACSLYPVSKITLSCASLASHSLMSVAVGWFSQRARFDTWCASHCPAWHWWLFWWLILASQLCCFQSLWTYLLNCLSLQHINRSWRIYYSWPQQMFWVCRSQFLSLRFTWTFDAVDR